MTRWRDPALAGRRRIARLPAASVLGCGASSALADKLTEENMTAKDFKRITVTESSVPGELRIEPSLDVHNFSDAQEQEKLPKAVKREPGQTHSGRRGAGPPRAPGSDNEES